jgi:hypothetical protein
MKICKLTAIASKLHYTLVLTTLLAINQVPGMSSHSNIFKNIGIKYYY